MASAASDRPAGWTHFRRQRLVVQIAVWVFALPVPVWLWALQVRGSTRTPALAFAGILTAICLIAPALGTRADDTGTATAAGDPTGTAPTTKPPTSRPPSTAPTTTPTTAPTSAPPAPPPPAPPPPTPAPAPEPTPPPQPRSGAEELLAQVRVTQELSDDGYDRGLFNHWVDVDGDSCDTRCEVLQAELRPDGTWLSVYDNVTATNPAEFDIDHVVALAEAWRSGAANWDPQRRTAFANDLDDPRSLIAVSASSNRSKSDRDPSSWLPPDAANRCGYITNWMAVKLRWDLAVDPIEFTALQSLIGQC